MPSCGYDYSTGGKDYWGISSHNRIFILNHHQGWRLAVRNDERLHRVIFDKDKKTVSAMITESINAKIPRKADISDNPEFFEDLRANIETILITGGYTSVTPNEDRTVFEVH